MKIISKFIEIYPGKRFGVYRFLPLFFVLGAALEFSMINWRVGTTNFYHSYKTKRARQIIEEKLKAAESS
ncbi:hypothetical protein PVAND_000277 [Polypedilum vanderplanki]|uniref:Small integral membrane protein 4 n=1 Tax=Polypedilum vanderplanki TaxID=319348 RepID=A0A9J6BJL5_POLVA|nr:hypothetical protein PVAND_000277 [Polypedilum vanderplanki]